MTPFSPLPVKLFTPLRMDIESDIEAASAASTLMNVHKSSSLLSLASLTPLETLYAQKVSN